MSVLSQARSPDDCSAPLGAADMTKEKGMGWAPMYQH